MVETLRINSGEYVGLNILRITTIPHLSILTDDQSVQGQQCAVIKAGQDFSGMLTDNGSLKFEITAKRLYAASQRVL